MKLRSKETYWLLRNGLIQAYPSLRKNIVCDVLIIGGGITGALMAYQFSREGYRTIVIDKRDIAMGSTSASTSMLQYELDTPLHALIETIGREAALETYKAGIRAIQKIAKIVHLLPSDCEFKETNSLYFAHNPQNADKLRIEFECRKSAGIKVKWLNKDQLMATYGLVGEGGILSETGGRMDVYKLTHALLQHSTKQFGLQVYDHTALEKIEYGNNENQIVLDTSNTITCKHTIFATGYETHQLIDGNIGKLVSTYACISEPFETLPASLTNTIFWNTQDPYFYCRTTLDNRILIGGEDEDFKNPEKRDALIEKKEENLVAKFCQIMPGVDFIADFSWAGTFGLTKDSLPYIGCHPKYPNSYFMLGFGGNGMTFSIMGMEILSDAVAGRQNKFLEYFKFNR